MSDVASTLSLEMFKSVVRAAGCLENDSARLISSYLMGQMNDDGGFRGRTKESDLYYTAFGMTALLGLGVEFPVEKTWLYLHDFGDGGDLDFVHLSCLVRCRSLCRLIMQKDADFSSERAILVNVEKFRSNCGGYSHTAKGAARGSVYAGFLAYCIYEDSGSKMPDVERVVRSISGLRCRGGGYSNEAGVMSGTTTATAAAMVLLKHIGMPVEESAIEWILRLYTKRGGFLAGEKAPVPDLLSTGTALHALKTLGVRMDGKTEACRSFIDLLWMENGGFAGSPADLAADCEYTFYALLGLGSL